MRYHTKLVLIITALVLGTGLAVAIVTLRTSRATAESLAESLFREASNQGVIRAQQFVLGVAPMLDSLGQIAPTGLALDNSDKLTTQLAGVLRANPGVTWLSYSDEQGRFTGVYRTTDNTIRSNQSYIAEGGRTELVEHDLQPDGARVLYRRKSDTGYDPRTRPFYGRAKAAGRLVWLPPYVFFDEAVPGITAAVPVSDASGKFAGVLTADFDMNALSRFIGQLSISQNSIFFLYTPDETLLAHPRVHVVRKRGQGDAGELLHLADVNDPLVDSFRQAAPRPQVAPDENSRFSGFRFQSGSTPYFGSTTAFRVDQDQQWAIGAIAPAGDFLGGVWRAQRIAAAIAIGALVLAIIAALLLARRVSRPVMTLMGFMNRVGNGELEAKADLDGSVEFRQLSLTLNDMIFKLRDRVRMRHALSVATDVQKRLLPSSPPRVPGLDIAGHSTYCEQTGGDYYDFLILNPTSPTSVMVAMGDVMGHGVAAALIMAGARAVLRDRASNSGSLASVMMRLNALLTDDLDGSRFMTMHLSLFDSEKRIYRWCSAGHDPAIIYDPQRDIFTEIDAGDVPLGVVCGTTYEEHEFGPIAPGSIIFIGTDGVWETRNRSSALFGKERLRELFRRESGRSAQDIADRIIHALDQFRSGTELTDDVTFAILKVTASVPASLVSNDRASL